MHRLHWLLVGISLSLTLVGWYVSNKHLNNLAEDRFLIEKNISIELIKERMQIYENALWAGNSFIDNLEGNITYPKWLKYSNKLLIHNNYPGINGIGVIFNIKPDELNPYLKREQKWRPDFKLHPDHTESEFWPITYIEPANSNRAAIGLDVAFETNRYSAIKKARDTGTTQATAPITLVQDAKMTPGFLLYAPFYKKGLQSNSVNDRRKLIDGVVYAPFISSKLVKGVLGTRHRNRSVSILIEDNNDLIYQDDPDTADPSPLFNSTTKVEIYGREWSFQVDSNMRFRETTASNQPLLILFGGVLISSLLFYFLILLSKANKKALSYADQMTAELQIKSDLLEKSNADLDQFAYVASHDLRSPLNAINKVVGWIEDDIGDKIPEDSKAHLQLLRNRTDRMINLLNDLLSYARIGKINLSSEPLELKALCNNIFESLEHTDSFLISVKETELNLPRIPFELVMRNLISNALKHHDKNNGTINVSAEKQTSGYFITVKDNGPGIPPEMHDKALQMFQTLKPRDKVEGSGMGLSIVSKMIKCYGGEISIDSDGIRSTSIDIYWPIS
jgi:signal transduction histidine kinase